MVAWESCTVHTMVQNKEMLGDWTRRCGTRIWLHLEWWFWLGLIRVSLELAMLILDLGVLQARNNTYLRLKVLQVPEAWIHADLELCNLSASNRNQKNHSIKPFLKSSWQSRVPNIHLSPRKTPSPSLHGTIPSHQKLQQIIVPSQFWYRTNP